MKPFFVTVWQKNGIGFQEQYDTFDEAKDAVDTATTIQAKAAAFQRTDVSSRQVYSNH